MSIEATLAERGTHYGEFKDQAEITQKLKFAMRKHMRSNGDLGWNKLTSFQCESLDMIANKIGRILNGDPNYADSWHDICGYAKLVEDELTKHPTVAATKP